MQLLLMHGLWRSNHFENLEMPSPQSEVKINYPEVNEVISENWIAAFHAIRAHSKKSAYDMHRSLFCLACAYLAHFGRKAGFFFRALSSYCLFDATSLFLIAVLLWALHGLFTSTSFPALVRMRSKAFEVTFFHAAAGFRNSF